ncbi:cysteine hydrolase family protein [Thalassobaculum litoreum]|uniref:Nicotinamidase-related amidase n=1 Tax=Thalassobaculum litoreum DSM 18839 TaxID=1123362 RepID=A0A8G2BHT0_9PROT|nr:cysteine hydrolase [Thalassobaculum litoreum]SDF76223.1 Nicotinamidase-related amidase [Thalassobaculum litoreum DSM 18839]
MPGTVIVANHYQNENCHPDGKVKVGIAADADWRWQRLDSAKRLFAGARAAGVPIVHVRLAVDPEYRDVIVNTALIREWLELGAWKEGTWGTEFVDGLGPMAGEHVVTHTRNSGFQDSTLAQVLFKLGARHLICCGVSTAYTVEGTVRHAADIGYEVTVASDACSTATEAQHDAALAAMSVLAEIKSVDAILAAL